MRSLPFYLRRYVYWNMTDYVNVHFRCSKLLIGRLKRVQRKRGCTLSDVIRSACVTYVNDLQEKEKTL